MMWKRVSLFALLLCACAGGLLLDERNRIVLSGSRTLETRDMVLGIRRGDSVSSAIVRLEQAGLQRDEVDEITNEDDRICGDTYAEVDRDFITMSDTAGIRKGYACLIAEHDRVVALSAAFVVISLP